MKYYKAVKDGYDYFNKHSVIKNELFTEKERNTKVNHVSDSYFEIVNISKFDTYFSFGVRLEKHKH